jgi:hypothetical protein
LPRLGSRVRIPSPAPKNSKENQSLDTQLADRRTPLDTEHSAKIPPESAPKREIPGKYVPDSAPWPKGKPPSKHLQWFTDKDGRTPVYLRRGGYKSVALPTPSSTEFKGAYAVAIETAPRIEIGARIAAARRNAHFAAAKERAIAAADRKSKLLKLYIIRAGKGSRFKIGISRNPKSRLLELQTGSALSLKLVAVVVASVKHEREAHRILAPWRRHGEWFDLGGEADCFTLRAQCCAGNLEKLFIAMRDAREAVPLWNYKNSPRAPIGVSP